MKILKVRLEVEPGKYTPAFALSDYFCPVCGCETVWEAIGNEDYYAGEKYWCVTCNIEFNFSGYDDIKGKRDLKALELLKNGPGVLEDA